MLHKIGYYVYRLVDPRTDATFYVGKGVGNRIFQHVAEAIKSSERVSLKLDRIREIEAANLKVKYVVHRHGLTEEEAFEVEASLIDAYQLAGGGDVLTNLQGGHHSFARGSMGVDDLVAVHAAEIADIEIPTLFLNLRNQFERSLTAEQLYERTRGNWVLRPDRHERVKHAMPVAFGVIREVYRIERWTQIDVRTERDNALRRAGVERASKSDLRWRFDGHPDEAFRKMYMGRAVAFELRGQNPVSWLDDESLVEDSEPRPLIVNNGNDAKKERSY